MRDLLYTNGFDQAFAAQWTNWPMLVDSKAGRFVRAFDLWTENDRKYSSLPLVLALECAEQHRE
jgi:hypothetical protein